MVGAESANMGILENFEVVVAIIQSTLTLVRRLQAVSYGIVERHILRIVHLQILPSTLDIVYNRLHIGLFAVAVVEIEGQQGDVVFGLGVAVEQLVAILPQDIGLADTVEQLIGIGNMASALQQTRLEQVGDDRLHLAVLHAGIFLRHELLHTLQQFCGLLIISDLIVGEGHVVQCPQLAVDILGQRVLDVIQRLPGIFQTEFGILVAVDESILVQTVDSRLVQAIKLRPLLRNGFHLLLTAKKQYNCDE